MKKLSKGIFCLVVILIGVITINFLNTNNKNLKEVKINDKRLAVFIKQEDGSYQVTTSIPQSGYTLNTTKSTCSKGAIPTWSNNTLNLANLTTEDTNCYLYFDKLSGITTQDIITMNNPKESPTTFSGVATTDEGVFKVADGMYDNGTSYYWRGAATTNYVKFAGFCWRAVRINGDGSIRLIYDGTTCHANGTSTTDSLIQPTSGTTTYSYNTLTNQSNYVGWTYSGTSQRTLSGDSSNAKTKTEKWFDTNITGINLNKVDTSAKYCNDRDAQSGSTWAINGSTFYYAAYKRTITDRKPTLSCPSGDVYTAKVGAIIADEVMFAGGWNANNTSYYLYNGQNYWTMSPSYWSSPYAGVFIVNATGNLDYWIVGSYAGLRPVINLKSDTLFATGGNGTIDNPFIVEGAE